MTAPHQHRGSIEGVHQERPSAYVKGETPWSCRWPGCDRGGVSPAGNRRYCDEHKKAATQRSRDKAAKKARLNA